MRTYGWYCMHGDEKLGEPRGVSGGKMMRAAASRAGGNRGRGGGRVCWVVYIKELCVDYIHGIYGTFATSTIYVFVVWQSTHHTRSQQKQRHRRARKSNKHKLFFWPPRTRDLFCAQEISREQRN